MGISELGPLSVWVDPIEGRLRELEQTLIALRRHLHANPEPSCEERETSQYLHRHLQEAGIDARLCRDGLGVVADVDVGQVTDHTPRIAIRADIDALKIQDTKSTPYASQKPGLCHACGHDAHSAMVFGAAVCAAELSRSLPITDESAGLRLRFLFQPAEEKSVGAQWLVEQGVLDSVDSILGIHVDPERQLGTVGVRYGVLTANCDDVQILVEGRGGHSARPHHTRQPIAAAAQLVTALFQFVPRSVDSRNPCVFSIGRIDGGTLPNVIPDKVEIEGSLRTLDQATRARVKERIGEIVHGVHEISGTTIHVDFTIPIDAVVNDQVCAAALEAASRQILGDSGVQLIDQPSMGGEDFSAYLTRVPGALLRIGCAPPGFTAPFLHAPDFDVDERVLLIGSRILLRAALYLSESRRVANGGANI